MRLDKPFTDEQHAGLVIFCNANHCVIEDRGEFLESVETPPYVPTAEDKIAELKSQIREASLNLLDGNITEEEHLAIKTDLQSQIRALEN